MNLGLSLFLVYFLVFLRWLLFVRCTLWPFVTVFLAICNKFWQILPKFYHITNILTKITLYRFCSFFFIRGLFCYFSYHLNSSSYDNHKKIVSGWTISLFFSQHTCYISKNIADRKNFYIKHL